MKSTIQLLAFGEAAPLLPVGLKQPLKEGQTFPLSLTFAKGGKVDVAVPVARIGAVQPGDTEPMVHGHGYDEQVSRSSIELPKR
jgi:hypothetical protein